MRIGEQIKALREHKNIGRKELAAKLGITVDTLGKYESGVLPNPSADKLVDLGKALGVTIDYFVSNYSPQRFLLREKQVRLSHKVTMLPKATREFYLTHIQEDYDKVLIANGNGPLVEVTMDAVESFEV